MKRILNLKNFTYLSIFVAVLFLITSFTTISAQSGKKELTGYAWSSNIGWISFNCLNENMCADQGWVDYKVELQGSDMVGHAWSSNIGWIKFGDLSDFPNKNGTVATNARLSGTKFEGWARACSVFVDEINCSGDLKSDAVRGGWDGWISLSGNAITGNYAVTFDDDKGELNSYAWGSDVVGWVSFSGDKYGVKVKDPDAISVSCLNNGPTGSAPGFGDKITFTANPSSNYSSYEYKWYEGSGTENPISSETSKEYIHTITQDDLNAGSINFTVNVTETQSATDNKNTNAVCGYNFGPSAVPDPDASAPQISEFKLNPSDWLSDTNPCIGSLDISNISSCELYRNGEFTGTTYGTTTVESNLKLGPGRYQLRCTGPDLITTTNSQIRICTSAQEIKEI